MTKGNMAALALAFEISKSDKRVSIYSYDDTAPMVDTDIAIIELETMIKLLKER